MTSEEAQAIAREAGREATAAGGCYRKAYYQKLRDLDVAPTQARLREVLAYDPDSGLFAWRQSPSRRVALGDIAGSKNNAGYIDIRIDGLLWAAHRLAFVFMTGAFPVEGVDHINGVRSDNRWSNLRPVSQAQNMQNRAKSTNNKTGFRGVHWVARANKYVAYVSIKKRRYHLGMFARIEDAVCARDAFVEKHLGEFAVFANGINVFGYDLNGHHSERTGEIVA